MNCGTGGTSRTNGTGERIINFELGTSYKLAPARGQQLVKIFKEFYERIGKQPFDLHLEIDKKFENPKLYLKKDDIMQEIPNVEFELFNSTFNIQLYPKE